MESTLRIAGSFGFIVVVPILFRARHGLSQTTLMSAWIWSVLLLLAWATVWVCTQLAGSVAAGLADQLWYAVAVLALCPPVAVLGAKRPGTRVWTWFVLIPLIVVLSWPAWAVWATGFPLPRLRLAAPAVLGYAVVLVMSVGNYLGTRFFLAAVCYGAALVFLVGMFVERAEGSIFGTADSPDWATLLCCGAVIVTRWPIWRSARTGPGRFDRVWTEFRDGFGIVWANRIQVRINETAKAEGWPARLEQNGIVWKDPNVTSTQRRNTSERVEHTFRWLLRRFVDPSWIDERLQPEVEE